MLSHRARKWLSLNLSAGLSKACLKFAFFHFILSFTFLYNFSIVLLVKLFLKCQKISVTEYKKQLSK